MSMIATTLMSLEKALPRIGRVARWRLAGVVAVAGRGVGR
jgi:hypothetical protein